MSNYLYFIGTVSVFGLETSGRRPEMGDAVP